MAKIKIISNPYHKEIQYQRWNDEQGKWIPLNELDNYNSKLLSAELSAVFFPFIVKKIVDEIILEYKDSSGKMELVFEGTEDEYKDLQDICALEEYQNTIRITRGDCYLENARDIVEDINGIFDSVRPLVEASFSNMEKLAGEMRRFSDVSEYKIPICVMGNYSSGKSTFINALIGRELLPSGEEPVTAKIYKIERSRQEDRATVEFQCKNGDVKLRFDGDTYRRDSKTPENTVVSAVEEALSGLESQPVTVKISKVLEMLNSFDESEVSDLIHIKIPFHGGIWPQCAVEFVIFDTPGSNSATNNHHFKVLRNALDGFSNGLPIYISEYRSLDSTDNERLYQEIKSIEELDDRFTLIVINKADEADLTKKEHTKADEERILNLAVPKNLYSEGIFYVSSIMGLGSKTQGEFMDDHCAEIYEEKEQKYTNAASRFYKCLYKYNIMPEPLKSRSREASEKMSDIVYANSGLYAIEREIQIFAGKYSPYNKCKQAHLFLGRVIRQTEAEIAEIKREREGRRQRAIDRLDEDKQKLIYLLSNDAGILKSQCMKAYEKQMKEQADQLRLSRTLEEFREKEKAFIAAYEDVHAVKELKFTKKGAHEQMRSNIKSYASRAVKERSMDSIKELSSEFVAGLKWTNEANAQIREQKKESREDAVTGMLEWVISEFDYQLDDIQNRLEERSIDFWERAVVEIKDELAALVTESTTLSEEHRKELSNIIMDYEGIVLERETAEIFARKNLRKGIRLGLIHLVDTGQLNTKKLRRRYNQEISKGKNETRAIIQDSHKASFESWLESLMDSIQENIEELNPTLHDNALNIKESTAVIEKLENQQMLLKHYTNEIRKMMDWKVD